MKQISLRLIAVIVLATAGLTNYAHAVQVDEICFNGPPPPGFVGPNPTGICVMDWSPGGPAREVRHRGRITLIVPPVGLTDDDTWISIVSGSSSGSHTWVIQFVCVSSPPAVGDIRGDASAYRFQVILPLIPILDNRDDDITGGTYANNCP